MMINKEIIELNMEGFAIYGSYSDMLNPEGIQFGSKPVEFFRDQIQLGLGLCNTVSFSLCRLQKRDLIIEASEYHNYCGEMIIPLDGDILMHVGPATSGVEVPVKDIQIFRIPRGTIVCIRPGVWHQAAFAYECDEVNILVGLPERTYMNDCRLVNLPPEKQIKINV